MYCYKKDYLPTPFVKSILHLYESKTKLKGVEGKEVEYLNSKEMLNSCYGMSVTNPLRDEFTYNGEWDINSMTAEQNKNFYTSTTPAKPFLVLPVGHFRNRIRTAQPFHGHTRSERRLYLQRHRQH